MSFPLYRMILTILESEPRAAVVLLGHMLDGLA
jgi:hypothetical protein